MLQCAQKSQKERLGQRERPWLSKNDLYYDGAHTKVLGRVHTERRTANPIKITFAGEHTYQVNMRG